MRKLDRYSSLFFLIFSIVISYYSYRLEVGILSDPGPGFIFFYSSIFVGIMSLSIFISSFRNNNYRKAIRFENFNWIKVALVLAYILMYAIFLEKLGFFITTFLLIALLLGTIELKRLYVVILIALGASLVTYSVFELWLRIRLPKGIFGI